MSRRLIKLVFLFFILLHPFISFADQGRYFIDPDQLNSSEKRIYIEAKSLLDGWTGEKSTIVSANKLIESLLAERPDFLASHIQKARFQMMYGHTHDQSANEGYKKAIITLEKVLSVYPDYAKAHLLLASVYVSQGLLESAKNKLEKAETIGIKDPWLYINWARLYSKKGERLKSLNKALLVLDEGTTNMKALSASLNLVSDAVDIETLFQIITEALDKSDLSIDLLLKLAARRLAGIGGTDIKKQIVIYSILQHILRTDQNNLKANLLLMKYYLASGYEITKGYKQIYKIKAINAAESIGKQLMNTANDKAVYALMAHIYFNSNKLENLNNLLSDAETLNLDTPGTDVIKAHLLNQNNEYVDAILMYKKVIDEAKNIDYIDSARHGLRTAYLKNNQYQEVENMYLEAIEQDGETAHNLGNFAEFLLSIVGDIDKSIEYSRKALAIMNYPKARIVLASALYSKWANLVITDKIDDSIRYLTEANSIRPDIKVVMPFCGPHCIKFNDASTKYSVWYSNNVK